MLIRDWLKRLKDWARHGLRRPRSRANHPLSLRRNRVESVEMLEDRVLLAAWITAGPTSITNGQLENIANRPVIGALHTVATHPTNADVIYVGGVNGGIWKTSNATAASPSWTPETDFQESLSISSIEFDATDGTHNTLVAGVGRFSSFAQQGGPRSGMLRTTDGGATWVPIDGGGTLDGKNIYAVAARGSTLIASVNEANTFAYANIGIFRSTNTGASFTQLTSANSGLPRGEIFDLVSDPSDNAVFYCGIVLAENGANGIYKSTDTGANWTQVSGTSINSLISDATTNNIEISVGTSNNVYVAIMNDGQLSGLFRSGDGGGSFTQLDSPSTNEGGTAFGLQPREHPGGQGAIHFSIVADPNNANVVYVGGDRQPAPGPDGVEGTEDDAWPNSLGATEYDGRLFRVDASKSAGSQAVHLTHSNSLGAAGGGTANSSAPHADSRDMAFDALGRIIEVDDGGIYRRTSPQNNTGDWFSVMGNLQVTEMHDVAYDTLSNTIISGNQDAGTTYQISSGSLAYDALSNADGGDVAVDNITLAGSNQSIRYSSFQNLAAFRRTVWNAAGNLVSTSFPALTVTSGADLTPQFRTSLELNLTDPQRIVFVGQNSVYESSDAGATIVEINDGGSSWGNDAQQSAIAYGHPNNADALWVGQGTAVRVRTTSGGSLNATSAAFPGGGRIRELALDTTTATANTAFVIDDNQVYLTSNTGSSWTDITGNLAALGGLDFRSIAFLPLAGLDAIVVGTQTGVYYAVSTAYNVWRELGSGLPNVLAYDLDYDAADDVLVVGTIGRGAWKLLNVTQEVYSIDFGDAPDTGVGTGTGNYQTLLANGGPRHDFTTTQTTLFLGARVDGEVDATQNPRANGDDVLTLPDDEEGLLEPAQDLVLTIGTAPVVRVRATNTTGSTATLYGWIDYNRDGAFDNATERASATVPTATTNGTFILTFPTISVGAGAGATYARFRLSSDAAAANSTGLASGGEVEDYTATMVLPSGGTADSAKTVKIASATNGGPTLASADRFGNSVASLGDLDGDGVTDLAVGAYGDDTGGSARGAVHVLFMNSNGTVKSKVKIANGLNGGPTLANGVSFGSSVASLGDLDGDGVTDLAVGAELDSTGGFSRGAVFILLLNASGSVKSSVKIASGMNGGPTLANNDTFGWSVTSLGDLDGDGVADLAVGASNDGTGGANRGALHVLLLNASGTVKSSVKIASGMNGGPTLADGDRFANSVVSLGDLDGDGVTDLAVGAYHDNVGRGAVYVLLLNSNGTVKSDVKLASGTNGVPTLATSDQFGDSVASLGDLNGDGVTDLAVGANGDDTGGTNRGAVYVLRLNSDGTVQSSGKIASGLRGGPTLVDSDAFGGTVAVLGDQDGDGFIELAVGASGDDTGVAGLNFGAVYVLYLKVPDTTPPTLDSFTRQTPSSSLTNADTLVFRATFNEAVDNVDAADFTVTGTTAGVTGVSAVSGSNGLQYDITVSGGDLATLNGTVGLDLAELPTITDLEGNALPTTEPAIDETFDLENLRPLLTITPNGTTTNSSPITFTFQFTEVVTGFNAGDVNVTNGTQGTFTAVDGDTYTLVVTPVADGTVSVSVNANAATDSASNGNTAASASITVDRTAPTLSITPNGTSTNAAAITFTFQFTEVVTGFEVSDINVTNGTQGAFSAVDGDTYTLVVTPVAEGTVSVNVNANAAFDAATNGNTAASASMTSDRTSPALGIAPDGTLTNAASILFTFQFSELATGFNASDISVTNGTKGTFTAVDGDTYTLLVTPVADGAVSVSVNANAAFDAATNGNTAASATVTSDRTRPTLGITPNAALTNAASTTFTFQFSEIVTGFNAGDVNVTNGSKGIFSVVDGDTYTLVVTPVADGVVSVSVNANAASDAATNGNLAASATITSDRTAPTLGITPNGTLANAASITFTFQFSETVTGFGTGDVNVTNGTKGTFTAVDGDTYTLAVTPTSDGTVSASVGANAAQDAATNGNLAASASVTSDRTPPGLSITPNGSTTNATSLTFTFQFTEPVIGFMAADVSVTNGTAGTFTTIDSDTYTLSVTPAADGIVSVNVGANAAQDAATNGNLAASTSVTSDRTSPGLSITPNGGATNAGSITFTFQFTENVTGFATGDISITNGTAGTFTAVDGDTYTLVVTPTADGTVSVSVGASTVQDVAANGNLAASASVISDRTAPGLSIAPNDTATNASPITFTFQFTEAVSGFTAGDVVLTNGSAGTFTAVDGDTYTLQVVPTSNGTVSINVGTNVAQDAATNGNPAASASVISDRAIPTATITPVLPDPRTTAVSSLTITFSEAIAGLGLSDLTLTRDGGANLLTGLQTLTTADNVTFTLGNFSELTVAVGSYQLRLNATGSGIQDAAGNLLLADATIAWTRVNPAVTLNLSNNSIAEAAGSATLTATLSSVTDVDVTVALAFTGTATFPLDYSRGTPQIVVPAGSTSAAMTLTAVSDGDLETTELIVIEIASITNGSTTGSQQTIAQIIDDDHAPVFTSATSHSVPENSTAVVTVTAMDADVPTQTLTYSISSGVDQGLFSITTDGVLTFRTAPNFEVPTDTGTNNVYNVQVRVNDGHGGIAQQNLVITVTNVDEIAPTVGFEPVSPDPRNTPLDTITIVFSEAVNGFDLGDLSLTRNGGANLLTGSQTLTTVDNITFTLSGLSGLTTADGSYVLTLNATASGIVDLAGNSLANGSGESWTVDATPPTVTITEVTPDPRTTAVSSLTIVFSEEIAGFGLSDLSLTRDGGPNLLTGFETLTTSNNTTFTLGNLNGLTGPVGSYTLTLNAVGSAIQDAVGNPFAADAVEVWSRVNPTVTLAINNTTISEAAGTATVTATLSAATDVNVTVVLEFSGAATFPGDYSRGAVQIVISAGNTTGAISLTALQDVEFEAAESITVDIVGVTNGVENETQQVSTQIIDDDHAPVFISTATPGIAENSTLVLTVIATDADVPTQTIAYSISGGVDQGLFSISAAGDLSFQSAPNFESPADSDINNAYEVQVTANDGHGGVTARNITIVVTDIDETPKLNLGGPAVTWIKRQPPVNVLPQITVGGAANLAGGTLTINVNAVRTPKKSLDQFDFPPSSGLGSSSGTQFANGQLTLRIQLNQTVTNGDIQSFLRGITFATKGKGLKTLTRTLDITLVAVDGLSGTVRQTINVRKK